MAQSLDILQGEQNHSNAYMGYLAPTVSQKLVERRSSTTGLEPLIDALLCGIDKRFSSILSDEKVIAAAIVHPKFKEHWTKDKDLLQKGSAAKINKIILRIHSTICKRTILYLRMYYLL